MNKSELGPLDMEKYLNYFGVQFNIKDDGNKTLYRLQKCLFNPDHGPNEASIVVPRQGAILYQCFHSSCKTRTWKEARREISGDKPLSEFCIGFDPNWVRPRETGTGIMLELAIPMKDAAALQNGIGSGPELPAPTDVDPREFYERKGKRPVFVPMLLTKYLASYLNPICCTSGIFYHYAHGVWKEFPRSALRQICAHALKNETQAAWLDQVISILSATVNREETEWSDDPTMINVKNGMINMLTRELLPHHPGCDSRIQLSVNFKDPEKWSKRWFDFLVSIFPDDQSGSKKLLLQQFFGYCLIRDQRYHKALFLHGSGANGKSTVLDVLTAMVGKENISALTLSDLQKTFRPQFLNNKLVNLASETNTRDPVTMETFKAVVDGSLLISERKYGEPFLLSSFAKWIISMNEMPIIPDKTYGFERRIIVLEFNRRFEKNEIIDRYAEFLIEEIDQIFTWAMEGLSMLLAHKGFRIPEQIEEDTANAIMTLNPLLIFTKESCELGSAEKEKKEFFCSTTQMWNSYVAWCTEGKNRPLGRNKFYEQLMSSFRGIKKKDVRDETADGREIRETRFIGIRLNDTGLEYAEKGKRRSDRMFD